MLTRLIARWISTATAQVTHEIEGRARVAGLRILAVVLILVAIAFATWLAFDELVAVHGVKVALGAMAGGFTTGAVALIVWASHLARQNARPAAPTENPTASAAADQAGSTDSELQGTMDDLISLLGSAGLRKEAFGLMAAKGALGDIKPVHLVGLGLLAGFIAGRGK